MSSFSFKFLNDIWIAILLAIFTIVGTLVLYFPNTLNASQ